MGKTKSTEELNKIRAELVKQEEEWLQFMFGECESRKRRSRPLLRRKKRQ